MNAEFKLRDGVLFTGYLFFLTLNLIAALSTAELGQLLGFVSVGAMFVVFVHFLQTNESGTVYFNPLCYAAVQVLMSVLVAANLLAVLLISLRA